MKEFRCIIFNEHEVISAVIDRRRRAQEKMPIGTIIGIKYTTEGKNTTKAVIRISEDNGSESELSVQTTELVASLIEYCANRKIPLPKGARRWVELIGKADLTLIMDFDPFKKRISESRIRAKKSKRQITKKCHED